MTSGTGSASATFVRIGGGVPGWAKAFWVVLVLIVPGGFLVFLAYAFGRAFLNGRRVVARANGGEVHLKDVLAQVRLSDVLREVRASI
jgi:hypothetical protein